MIASARNRLERVHHLGEPRVGPGVRRSIAQHVEHRGGTGGIAEEATQVRLAPPAANVVAQGGSAVATACGVAIDWVAPRGCAAPSPVGVVIECPFEAVALG